MKNLIYTVGLGLALCGTANAQRIYHSVEKTNGTKDVVSVMVPNGWAKVISDKPGVAGKHLLVKADEVDQTVNNGMIFIQSVPVESFIPSSDNVVEHEKMMYASAGVIVSETTRLATESDNTQVRIVNVTGGVDGQHQVIAYMPLPEGMVSVTLCTPFKQFLDEHIGDFESLVKSYKLNPHLSTPEVPLVTDLGELK
jgi:hypothetical protein